MLVTAPKEDVKFWLMPHLDQLELLHATYINHSFTKHVHEGFAIGVIESGALQFSYRGETIIAPSGHINLVIPGEAHDGHAASQQGWSYRMFYLTPKLLQQAASELSGDAASAVPFFRVGTIKDDELAGCISRLHLLLEQPDIPVLTQESLLLTMLTQFIARHADQRLTLPGMGKENRAVRLVREYIEDTYNANISIQELSSLCNLSPFHLIRVFKEEIGVPPHVYHKQVRLKRAKEFLGKGFSLAYIAQEMGFADQSHFSRQFKQVTGVTPSKYSNIVQEYLP